MTQNQDTKAGFSARFDEAYKRVSDGGLASAAHNGLRLFLAVSAVISFVWFWNIMPGLFLNPALYPTAAPFLAGLVGVLSMEGAAWLWNNTMQKEGLTVWQIRAARIGLTMAVLMSIVTTVTAVVSAMDPVEMDRATTFVFAFVQGTGLGYYIGGQVALGILYHTVLTDSASRGRHLANVSAKKTQAKRKRQTVIANSELAAHEALLGDVETVAKLGSVATHRRLTADLMNYYNLPSDLAAIAAEEIARRNHDIIIEGDVASMEPNSRPGIRDLFHFFGKDQTSEPSQSPESEK